MKDILLGILSGVALAAQMGWEWLQKWWEKRTSAQQSILIAVVIVLVSLVGWSVAHAEPANEDTNYQLLQTAGTPSIALCPLQEGVAETGVITLCLVGLQMGENMYMLDGTANYCVVTGVQGERPFWNCGSYEYTKSLVDGMGV